MHKINQFIKTTLLLSVLTGIFMGVGYLLGGRSGAVVALLLASLVNFSMFWFSHKLVLKMQRAKPLDQKVYAHIVSMVQELAIADNLPMPKLYFVDSPVPNAFATGRSPKNAVVAVTRGITELLSHDELKAVLAHELGHVKNRDMLVSTIAATLGGAVSMLAEMALWSNLFGGSEDGDSQNPLVAMAAFLLAPISALLIQMAVSRSREYLADQHGASLIGSGKPLASALQKLDGFKHHLKHHSPTAQEQSVAHLQFMNMFSARGMSSLFSTHPSTASRIKKLTNKE